MIDAGLNARWPDEVRAATAKFKQGNLVENPPFFYAATPKWAIWDFTSKEGDPGLPMDLLQIDVADCPPFGLITTQTCDLDEQRPSPRKPWIQVAPVYDANGLIRTNQQRGQLDSGNIYHLVHLTSGSLPGGLWVADLRLEFPVEKSWLVGRDPIEAFDGELGYLDLAQRLAGLRERPALANELVEVVKSIDVWIDGLDALQRAEALSASVRIIVGGDRLRSDSAQLLLIGRVPITESVRNLWEECWKTAHTAARANGVELIGNRYETLASLSAAEYLRSAPLQFDAS